jgi:phenylalanyl-tRNA synthetase beta chain
MNISYRWLRELIPGLPREPRQVADRLAMLGAPVDEVVDLGGPLRDIVVARVEHSERHPNADRLSLCTVNAGTGYTLQVVCGAPNVKAGAYYPFAPVGASLPEGISIRRAKIRGVESQGMLCSARELGLGRDHEGILELHGELVPGRSFIESVGLDDARLLVDVTPNRPDLLSHLGVAREIAAAEGLRAQLHPLPGAHAPDFDVADATAGAAGGIRLSIEDGELCPRYYGLIIRGVTPGPSPEWLASRLRAIGARPISNIVDATNYVLHELGQPLHAFDLDRLGDQVVVRRARAGERITTLDGVDRMLTTEMLVIADASRPVAVAGVMGGADTEVHDDTRDLLIECALFDPAAVRAGRRGLGLNTDASYRFERGVDPEGMLRALRRVAELITAVAGGATEGVAAAAGPGLTAPPDIRLRPARVQQVLGVAFDAAAIGELLRPLDFDVSDAGDGALRVSVPGHRRYDVSREEDLIEEIARRHGYDAFPDELRAFRPGTVPSHPLFALEDRLRTHLVGRGFLEARTAAFAPESEGDVTLLHPLAATESRLRRALLPGLLRRVEYNFDRGARSIRLFEIGTAFAAAAPGELPRETTRVALAFTGPRRPPHWSEPDVPFDAWDMKAMAGELAQLLGLHLDERAEHPQLDAGASFRLVQDGTGELLGMAGLVRVGAVDAPAWAGDVWGIEVELRTGAQPSLHARELPAHPATERDLALLVPQDLPAGTVVATIREAAGPLLEYAGPFDVYSGRGVPERMRSIAVRLRFRASDRTLTDAEVDARVRNVLQRLNDEFGIQQRA